MVQRSPYPDVDIPEIPIHAFVLERAPELRDKPALIDGPTGRILTYGALAAGVADAAAGFAARGLSRGDVVGIFAPNMPEWAIVFHAVSTVGATNTTVNSLATERDVAAQLADAEARFLVTVPSFLDRALPAAERAGIEEVFVLEGEASGATSFGVPKAFVVRKADVTAEDLIAYVASNVAPTSESDWSSSSRRSRSRPPARSFGAYSSSATEGRVRRRLHSGIDPPGHRCPDDSGSGLPSKRQANQLRGSARVDNQALGIIRGLAFDAFRSHGRCCLV